MKYSALTLTAGLLLTLSPLSMAQEKSQQLIDKGLQRLDDNQVSQVDIDSVNEVTKNLEKDYLAELKLLDGLNMYNAMLEKQLRDQEGEVSVLNSSISSATVIERQIVPLLVRMVDALETYVEIDIPFLKVEREQRVQGLRTLLENASLSTSEKCRRVFEAYQIENEFGYTIETYKGRVELSADNQLAVEFLRIGRVALLFRDMSGNTVGHWNSNESRWQVLTDSQYKRHIAKGLKVAKEEIAPELITIPLLVKKEVK